MTQDKNRLMPIARRRFIAIAASAAGLSALPRPLRASTPRTATWRGVALGAPAMLTLQHPDEAEARDAILACLAEVTRLEAVFSLHRADSTLVRLNATGRLDEAPADLRLLLAEALALAQRTNGAFDPTIQPLWLLHARHFDSAHAASGGPDAAELAAARALVGWRGVHIEGGTIRLDKPGMALTLNGIAQGYITDKVGDILRARGFAHVLVDMGEQLALGPKWDGTAWRVGLRDPYDPERVVEKLPLAGGAVATSSNFGGAPADPKHRLAHILDPRTGRPADAFASVSVVSDRATHADGLSTALTLLPADRWPALLVGTGSRAYATPVGAREGYWV